MSVFRGIAFRRQQFVKAGMAFAQHFLMYHAQHRNVPPQRWRSEIEIQKGRRLCFSQLFKEMHLRFVELLQDGSRSVENASGMTFHVSPYMCFELLNQRSITAMGPCT